MNGEEDESAGGGAQGALSRSVAQSSGLVTTARGRALKTFVRNRVPVGEPGKIAFTCTLPKGSYRYVVRGRDGARNPEAAPGVARLTVR